MSKPIALVYMGGTFGCVGQPLQPLEFDDFLPVLHEIATQQFPLIQHIASSQHIRDSSQLVPEDWIALLQQLKQLQTDGFERFLLIQGTDTLAYTAAFLAEYLALIASPIAVVLTGSQYPLLNNMAHQNWRLNTQSDALPNLQAAYAQLANAKQHQAGCQVAFDRHIWPAHAIQKIHTTDLPAFSAAMTAIPLTVPTNAIINLDLQQLRQLSITIYYVLPVPLTQQVHQLAHMLQQPGLQALVILAFGAGNLPQHSDIEQLLQQAKQRRVLVILTSQVPFGGVHCHYAAGHWLAKFGVLSAAHVTVPAIYARLALLLCQCLNFEQRRMHWQQALGHLP